MTDLIVVGTDTDAGKTTFSLLWLSAFAADYAYWKPLETGPSDMETVRGLVPTATVFDPFARFEAAVAPMLAARQEGRTIPSAEIISELKPESKKLLLIETFGGPLSPLNEKELQVELIRRLNAPAVLVTSSAVGAIGRTLAMLRVLKAERIDVAAVVLLGPEDTYAAEQIERHGGLPVVSLQPPESWDAAGVAASAAEQKATLQNLRALLFQHARNSVTAIPELGRHWDNLQARDAAAVWHPYTPLRGQAKPLPVESAEREFLYTAQGSTLIDAISSWWTILHGHCHPPLMDALRLAADKIDHVLFAGVTHSYAIECAERLLKTAPWPNGRVFFSDNGSTAVEVALKMAYQWWHLRDEPQRTLFVGFEGAYHGDTFGAMAIGRDPLFFGRFDPLLFRALQVPVSAERLDAVLQEHGNRVAAVVIEPLVQGAGGMRMHTSAELRAIYDVARRHGVLFIVDEVMTCGRTGSFWAHTQADIAPDLICAAKTLAGGVMPLAATLVAPQIVAAFDTDDRTKTFFHGHSFTAHPLACAVAAENLRSMEDGQWLAQSRRIEDFWHGQRDSLRALPSVRDVRICGTILAVEIEVAGGYLAEVGQAMRDAALDKGVLLRPLGNVLYAMPPLCTSDGSLGRIADAMRSAVGKV